MKLFLDTNILIDYIAQRQPYCEAVKKLCVASYFEDVELWVSSQSFLDTLYSLRKFASQDQLRMILKNSLEFFHVAGIKANDILMALESKWPDAEDFVISQSALNVGADYLITRDAKGFTQSKVKVLTADDVLALFQEQDYFYDWTDL